MTSEICQDMVAASEKDTLEAPRARGGRGGGGGGGAEGVGRKKGIPFSHTRSFTTIRNPSPVYQKGQSENVRK